MNKEIRTELDKLSKRIDALEVPKPSGKDAFDTGKYGPNPEVPVAKLYQKDMDKIGGPEKLAAYIKARVPKASDTEAEAAEIAAFKADYPELFK